MRGSLYRRSPLSPAPSTPGLPLTQNASSWTYIRGGVKYVFVFANTNTNTDTVYLYLIKFETVYLYLIIVFGVFDIRILISLKRYQWLAWSIGRTVPLLKPPQSPHCYLGEVDHTKKNFPPPLATRQARSYRANWATQPLDLAQVWHGNKICSKPALTWKLTLVLAFPAHCLSN